MTDAPSLNMMGRCCFIVYLLKLLLVVVHAITTSNGGPGVFYIIPVLQQYETFCPQDPCISLSQFAANSSSYICNGSNITLYLLPGHHRLDYEILVSNAESFTMTNYMQDNSAVLIDCSIGTLGRLKINLTTFVFMNGWLHFIGCGDNKISMVNQLAIEKIVFQSVVDSSTALKLNAIAVARITRSIFNISSYDNMTTAQHTFMNILLSMEPWITSF